MIAGSRGWGRSAGLYAAAGALLVREAGGLVAGLTGEPDFMQTGDIVAATPKVFSPFLEAIRP